MHTKFILLIWFFWAFSSAAIAQIRHAPPSFVHEGNKIVFVDFKKADYELTYDSSAKKTKAITSIQFESDEAGMPVFDLVSNPLAVTIDGEPVEQKLINAPLGETSFRIILKNIQPGNHTLKIESTIDREVQFNADSVYSAFWFNDFNDRSFLEAYLPANLEYDQYPITFQIDFKNLKNQKIYSNGKITKVSDSKFTIEFPPYFTSSSLYFHTDRMGKNNEMLFNFKSIDGRSLPVTLYTLNPKADLNTTADSVIEILKRLEKKFGPYPYSTLTILDSGDKAQAMEYCGALTFDPWTLQHEITHSWFARAGFMPSDGNAGWIDEAIVYWHDQNSPKVADLKGMHANMGGHSDYRRASDSRGTKEGALFMAYLHNKFQSKGGLFPFLKHLAMSERWKPMTTLEFKDKMSSFFGEDLTEIFNKHVIK